MLTTCDAGHIDVLTQSADFEVDAERHVSVRLQREEMTLFASKLALAEEARTLDVEVRSWFKRTYAKCENSLTDHTASA